MECENIKLKIQALIDNELPENEINAVVSHMQSCYRCRNDYIDLLKLQNKMKGLENPEPAEEWFIQNRKRWQRKSFSVGGRILFFTSYLLLILYTVYSLFIDKSVDLLVKLSVGGAILGILFLAGVTIADRIRENKTDRYKGVMK